METISVDDCAEFQEFSKLLDESISGERTLDDLDQSQVIQEMVHKIGKFKEEMQSSRTTKLWIQYINMVDIFLEFIKAERIGDFKLHLKVVNNMLPYFAASGHIHYMKSVYIYVQSMIQLEETNPDVYAKFCQGYHVVRASGRY